jgi:hypothetical protein
MLRTGKFWEDTHPARQRVHSMGTGLLRINADTRMPAMRYRKSSSSSELWLSVCGIREGWNADSSKS